MTDSAHTHTLKAFDEELDEVRALVSQMGGLAEHAIREAIRCLVQRDLEGAARAVDYDRRIDDMETEAERLIVQMMAIRAPLADDLREAVAALKIVGIIERIGDYAKNIAKRVPHVQSMGVAEPLSILPEMARIAAEMVHDVLDAFVHRDAAKAQSVWERDRIVDDFYNSLFRTLLTFMMEDPANITPSAHLLFVAKNVERIGDHATNIAEMVYFAATGERLAERQRGLDLAKAQ